MATPEPQPSLTVAALLIKHCVQLGLDGFEDEFAQVRAYIPSRTRDAAPVTPSSRENAL